MANIPKSFRTSGRSSEVKGKYYTTYVLNEKHPGMTDIGAVEKFRKNIAEATHEANRQIAVAVNNNTLPAYIAQKTVKGARPENMPFNIKMFDTLGAITLITPPSMMNPGEISFLLIDLKEQQKNQFAMQLNKIFPNDNITVTKVKIRTNRVRPKQSQTKMPKTLQYEG